MNRKKSNIAIYIIIVISILSFIPLSHLKFDFSLDNMFPLNDPDVNYYKEFQSKFHTEVDEEVIFIGLKNSNGIFRV